MNVKKTMGKKIQMTFFQCFSQPAAAGPVSAAGDSTAAIKARLSAVEPDDCKEPTA